MRIDRLNLQNFSGFALREFRFNPHFNLLVGENASGKTSVLDALSIALGSWFLGMRGYSKVPGIESRQVRVVAYPHQDITSFEKQFPSRVEANGNVLGKQIEWKRELKYEGGRTSSGEAQSIASAGREAELAVRAGEGITLPLICTYGTERLWFESTHRERKKKAESENPLPSRLDGYRDCIDFTIQESSLLNWIRGEVSASQQRGKDTIALGTIRRAIVNCLEGAISLYYDERYKDVVVNMKRYGFQLFKNLSDGQRIVLTLAGDLVRRATTLNPHLASSALDKTPGVVLIDELDLHLHPKWQRHVIRDLKRTFPMLQFITTSHSPQLVGEAQSDEVIVLEEQSAANPSQSFGMDSNWILKHVMGADERDEGVKAQLEEIETLINKLDLPNARHKIDEARREIGDHPDLVRFSARIDRFSKKA